MERVDCIICDSNMSTPFIKVSDRFGSESFQIVECECGFKYLSPRPKLENISICSTKPGSVLFVAACTDILDYLVLLFNLDNLRIQMNCHKSLPSLLQVLGLVYHNHP